MSLEDTVRRIYGDLVWQITALQTQLAEAQKRIKELESDTTEHSPSD